MEFGYADNVNPAVYNFIGLKPMVWNHLIRSQKNSIIGLVSGRLSEDENI